MKLTLTKVQQSKNGVVSYKGGNARSNGIVYLTGKMFGSNPVPDTITVEADGLVEQTSQAPKPAKGEQPAPAAEAPAGA